MRDGEGAIEERIEREGRKDREGVSDHETDRERKLAGWIVKGGGNDRATRVQRAANILMRLLDAVHASLS